MNINAPLQLFKSKLLTASVAILASGLFLSSCQLTEIPLPGGMGTTFTSNTPPVSASQEDQMWIEALEPNAARAGEIIHIYGEHFNAETSKNTVLFAGEKPSEPVMATIAKGADNILEVIVPAGGITGEITVITGNQQAKSSTFYFQGNIDITSISPKKGQEDDLITIEGGVFSPNINENHVVFSPNIVATVVESSPNFIVVSVPREAKTGPITVTVENETFRGPVFTYAPH